tara:strand:+ start:2987 stop:3451 length:465 start_codon:yes stop_codon:yes gene_type:complete
MAAMGVGLQGLGCGGAVDQRIGAKAFFGDLVDEAVGRPQRLNAQALDIGQVAHRLRHLIQALERGGGPDRAAARTHHHRQPVGTQHVVAVGAEGVDVLVPHRHLLVEAGVHAQLQGEPAHHGREGQQHRQQRAAVAEHEVLDAQHGGLRSCATA